MNKAKYRRFFMKKLLMLLASLMLIFSVIGCDDPKDPEDQLLTGKFSLDNTSLTLAQIGETQTVVAMVDTTEVEATWTVSEEGIVTVSKDGVVTAIENGTVNVSAAYGDYTATCEVKVDSEFAVTLSVTTGSTVSLDLSSTYSLTPIVILPDVTDKNYAFYCESADESVATVDPTGKITAVGQGVTTITVKSQAEKTVPAAMPIYPDVTGPASAIVYVIVDNDFDETTHAGIAGSYSYTKIWYGVPFDGWVESGKSVLDADGRVKILGQVNLDVTAAGEFTQSLVNMKRANYTTSSPTNEDPYNRAPHTDEQLAADNELTPEITVFGMGSLFTESGFVFVDSSNEVSLIFNGKKNVLGNYTDTILTDSTYEIIQSMVGVNAEMNGMLIKE